VYYGTWGTNLFQSIYQPADRMLVGAALMPEEYYLCSPPCWAWRSAGCSGRRCSWPCRYSRWPSGALLVDAALGARGHRW
jgi:hypothetical protein